MINMSMIKVVGCC